MKNIERNILRLPFSYWNFHRRAASITYLITFSRNPCTAVLKYQLNDQVKCMLMASCKFPLFTVVSTAILTVKGERLEMIERRRFETTERRKKVCFWWWCSCPQLRTRLSSASQLEMKDQLSLSLDLCEKESLFFPTRHLVLLVEKSDFSLLICSHFVLSLVFAQA